MGLQLDQKGLWGRITGAFKTSEVQKIADAVGLSYQSVYKWQKGMLPSHETLVLIADLTNSSIDWLLTGEQQQPNLIQEATSEAAEEEEFAEKTAMVVEDAGEAEIAALFFNYREMEPEDKEELRRLVRMADEEVKRRKARREQEAKQ